MARRHVLALLVVQAAAFWPVWQWAAARAGEGDADEIVMMLAAVAALLIAPRPRRAAAGGDETMAGAKVGTAIGTESARAHRAHALASTPRLELPTLLTLIYAALAAVATPPLLRAMVAACALLATWCAWRWNARPHPAALGLVLLALPALPTAQFVLGFPLRAAAGEIAARLLQLAGLAVVREGVSLRMGERLVAIDAPCSGVNMLWMTVLLALVLAALGGASARRTATMVAAASALAVGGNALRAASLFLIESGVAPVPAAPFGAETLHASLGVVAFALVAAPLFWMVRRSPASTRTSPATAGVRAVAAEAIVP